MRWSISPPTIITSLSLRTELGYLYRKDASVNEHIEQMRLSATKALLERRDGGGGPVSAIYGLGDPDLYLKMMLHLTTGMLIDQRAILRRLAELQYTRNRRWPFPARHFASAAKLSMSSRRNPDDIALRIELFDGEVERLSLFDPADRHAESSIPRHTTSIRRPTTLPRERIGQAMEEIKDEAG